MSATSMISEIARKARAATYSLAHSTLAERNKLICNIADGLEKNLQSILKINQVDVEAAKAEKISPALIDRLMLNEKRVMQMAAAAREISQLPDPLGKILVERNLPNGLNLKQKTVPFGVVGMIYEARPNVTVDAAVILLKSGNAALLRGSASAVNTNQVLVEIMKSAFHNSGISSDVLALIPSDDRATASALLTARGLVDLVIPRGGAELIQSVISQATVPVIETGAGVCHVYVDKSADLDKAISILINSKCDRPSVCNAAETLLIDQAIAEPFTALALKALTKAGVVINCDLATKKIADAMGVKVKLATEQSWATEYGELEINIAQVAGVQGGLEHIAKFGTKHTEAIVATDTNAIRDFSSSVDCAAVMINASTRFTDGGQMGFGGEIGISNQKMHARGPMGIEQMTTTTWIVTGDGQIRE
jgi:glutamate-5-semialdehyde dehydrogenase